MSLLTVIRDVCPVIGVSQPTSVIPNISTNRTMQELLACANESAQAIAYDNREWTRLKTRVSFTGDGTTEAFNLPANFKRMLLKSNVWRSVQTMCPMRFIPDLDEWIQRRAQGYSDNYGEWTIYGNQIHIQPILAGPVMSTDTIPVVLTPAQTASFVYLDKNCISLASTGFGDSFQNDADTFRLDERLLKLYMIWKWKSQKGTAYAEDMSSYADALNVAAGADQPSPILIGRSIAMRNATVAYPWPVPT